MDNDSYMSVSHDVSSVRQLFRVGSKLEALILDAGPTGVIGLSLDSGSLVKIHLTGPAPVNLAPFETVVVEVAPDTEPFDPAEPEAVWASNLSPARRRVRRREVDRLLKSVTAPTDLPLLGLAGGPVPYWSLLGDRPSVTVVLPEAGPRLVAVAHGPYPVSCDFGWSRQLHQFPVSGRLISHALLGSGQTSLAGAQLTAALGFEPSYLLVSLSRPHDGTCYKTVATFLPGR
jgi:hypothetical protein